MSILMTGASGSLGTEAAAALIRSTDKTIYALIRAKDEQEAAHRLKTFWRELRELHDQIGDRIIPVAGDFTEPNLGLSPQMKAMLREKVSMVFHLGAQTGIQTSRQELARVNLDGTRNVLAFADAIHKNGRLDRFVFASTAYVAGRRSGTILETDPLPEQFSTYYEQSKAQAEMLVRASGLPYTICRPGMIVGNSKTGWTRNYNTVYYVLKLMLQGKLRVIPVSAQQKLNIAPVDEVAGALVRLSQSPDAKNKCFHLTAAQDQLPTAGELADYVCRWAREEMHLALARPIFLPLPVLKEVGLLRNRKEEEKPKTVLSNLLALMPYFYDDHVFDRTHTDSLLGAYTKPWQDYAGTLLRSACRHNFLHRTDRNVFEQVLFRLKSKAAPISYFDITKADAPCKTSGAEMGERIRRIATALGRLGVKKGDKVALTGINCTDYFALDIAIGLMGAVSVPIYYTTPIKEVDLLLSKSGAKWLFVGDKRIMKQMDDLRSDVPVVVFSGALEIAQADSPYLLWDRFLAGGEGAGEPPKTYVDPEDLATIRFTSGTTGEPKGVMFSAGQLAWMGQVMTDLLPWKAKQKEMRYLSFLPLSHVVEGILASYVPYYMHCPVKFFYLNDFDRLTQALPKVRPTVFFSVPRFYEKLWQQIEENPVGRYYQRLPDGPLKRAAGLLLRRAVLKKAGLDCCSQLIVGSAPISEELLLRFRALGVEIHNAYGQTEAPLITINRLGDNVIPSIGTPLPDTQVTVQEDGELTVKGPQVCLGYYGLESDSIRDGVLLTGDLGAAEAGGHIFLTGRKKEMIITSYGKNINCPKIEERLKNIRGVTEAVLIGENRPYCTALLWANAHEEELRVQIEKMNQNLSHPEQIRKWTVIQDALSIQKGELTPNLKVKRNVVQEHYQDAIRSMYETNSEKCG